MKTITAILLCILIAFGKNTYAQTGKDVHSKPIIIGTTHEIESAILGEKRQLNIYLPEGYNPADTTHYQIIYLLDGGVDEDFMHIVGLVQFNTFSWINQIPKSIVVGIANTDRKRDMTFRTTIKSDKEKYPTTGGSANFIVFIEKELQPYIQKQFKTSGAGLLIGQSLAGLLATEILLKKPALFDKYIIISPSLWWNNGSLLMVNPALSVTNPTSGTSVYIGVGKEGLTPTAEPRVMEVDANLLAEKLEKTGNKNLSVFYDYLPAENHATISHQAVFNAFRKLYKTSGE